MQEKKGRKKRQSKKKSDSKNNYFNLDTEKAIARYQKETNIETRKKIFVKEIRPAFLKLIENTIFVYKFHTIGDIDSLKNDCMSNLFVLLDKWNPEKGHAAFSYYNVVTKNWFIQRVKNHKKKVESDVNFDKNLVAKLEKRNHESIIKSFEDDILKEEFLVLLKEEVIKWRSKFEKPQEKMVLEAIIVLLGNPDLITLNNKKAIYLYLREITGLSTKQIVTNLSKFKKKYYLFKKKYLNGEL